jgi:NAD(P)-dependent dehydrogenase (short-subunit alcohol dehydrogenase family)
MTGRHEGRTVIVTGGASGIGRRIATAFAEEGATVVVADVQRPPRQGVHHDTDVSTPTDEYIEDHLGGTAEFARLDVSDPDRVSDVVAATVDRYGSLDVLVNNAGVYVEGDSQEVTLAEWDRVVSVNLYGTFYCSRCAVPHLKRSAGDIVNVASVNASKGGSGPPYAAAKAGVVNLTRDLAVELGPHDVGVNAICPGYVETPIQDYLSEAEIAAVADRTPLPRLGRPEDVADVAVFLASDRAAFVQGEAITVDGGLTAH